MKKAVGILGGTFDPPHLGHMRLAQEVMQKLNLAEVWFLPTGRPPHKDKTVGVTNQNRADMIRLMIASEPNFHLKDFELKASGKSYTYKSMRHFANLYEELDFYFIIGADMVESLDSWYEIDKLSKLVKFVAVNRPGYKLNSSYELIKVDLADQDISSTEIRKGLQEKNPVEKFLQLDVLNYIKEHKLYE